MLDHEKTDFHILLSLKVKTNKEREKLGLFLYLLCITGKSKTVFYCVTLQKIHFLGNSS